MGRIEVDESAVELLIERALETFGYEMSEVGYADNNVEWQVEIRVGYKLRR